MTDNTESQNDTNTLEKAQQIYQDLLTSHQSIVLATVNEDGSPLASYAPYAVDSAKNFYIFVSTLAHHTSNLLRSDQASLMVIADESETQQIFARERLTFACHVEELSRDTSDWEHAAQLYGARFGDMFKLIRGFKDFRMFRLVPKDGSLVVGFGQAYAIHGDSLDELTQRGNPDSQEDG